MEVFIQNLEKENQAIVLGCWFKLGDSDENLQAILKERLECKEGDFRVFISDYYQSDLLYTPSEYENIFKLNTLVREFYLLDSHYQNIVNAMIEGGFYYDLAEAIDHKDCFILHTDIQKAADLGHFLIEQMESCEVPDFIKSYIDYEAFGRDEQINSNGYFSTYGYIEEL